MDDRDTTEALGLAMSMLGLVIIGGLIWCVGLAAWLFGTL